MQIGPNGFLECGSFYIKYNLEKRLYKEYIDADQDNKGEIEKTMTADNNKNDDKKTGFFANFCFSLFILVYLLLFSPNYYYTTPISYSPM